MLCQKQKYCRLKKKKKKLRNVNNWKEALTISAHGGKNNQKASIILYLYGSKTKYRQ